MSLESANFQTYIYRVLKNLHPDTGLSGEAMASMNRLVRINIEKLMIDVNRLTLRTGKKTIGAREVHAAARLALPGELAKNAIAQAVRATTKYNIEKTSREEDKQQGVKLAPLSRNAMANLEFPVTRIQNLMMSLATATRKTDTAAVYLAAVCEYLVAEVLDLAGNVARENKRVRITPRHIMLAVRNDPELNTFYKNTVFAGGTALETHKTIAPPKKKQTRAKGSRQRKRKTGKAKRR